MTMSSRGAVRKVFDGQSVASVARELGVAEGLIHNWKKRVKAGNSMEANEVIQLKKKLREVEMERDILKKPANQIENGSVKSFV